MGMVKESLQSAGRGGKVTALLANGAARERFCAALESGAAVADAAAASGYAKTTWYAARERSPELETAWLAAIGGAVRQADRSWRTPVARRFFEVLGETGDADAAAAAVGRTAAAAYARRESEPAFAEAWRLAMMRVHERIEARAMRAVLAADPDAEAGLGAFAEKVALAVMARGKPRAGRTAERISRHAAAAAAADARRLEKARARLAARLAEPD